MISEPSLRAIAGRYADVLERPDAPSIGDFCYTINTTRERFDEHATLAAAASPNETPDPEEDTSWLKNKLLACC